MWPELLCSFSISLLLLLKAAGLLYCLSPEVSNCLTPIPALCHVWKKRRAGTLCLSASPPLLQIPKNSIGSESLVRIKDKVDLLTSALLVCNAHLFHLRPVIPLSLITPLSGVARLNVIHSPPFFYTLVFFFFKSHSISVSFSSGSLHLPPLLHPSGSSLKWAARKGKEEKSECFPSNAPHCCFLFVTDEHYSFAHLILLLVLCSHAWFPFEGWKDDNFLCGDLTVQNLIWWKGVLKWDFIWARAAWSIKH